MSRGSPACPHRGRFDEAFGSLHRWVAWHIAFAMALWAEENNAGAEGRRYQKIENPLINDVLRTGFWSVTRSWFCRGFSPKTDAE